MNIRPMDMQVIIPKAVEVSKAQQIEEQRSNIQQQQFAAEMQKSLMKKQQQVQDTSKSEGEKVEKDKEKQKHSKRQGEKDEEDTKEEKQRMNSSVYVDPVKGSMLDIET